MSRVARLFGSLANVVLDLGLPTIRGWLRERLGPSADVGNVTTDGARIQLDAVRLPIGPRGLLVLERATAVVIGRAGRPAIRLDAFEGVLVFSDGEAAPAFRAELAFTASPDPEESAWIWGDLEILGATWTGAEAPMHGSARLFVASQAWRLDAGRLEGVRARARFAGAGIFEPDPVPGLLVPAALATLALSLEQGRIGTFVEAMTALVGGALLEGTIPAFVPRDARIDGDLSWSSADGARIEVRIDAEALRATVRGAVGPTGLALEGRVDAHVVLAPLLLQAAVVATALPRASDRVEVALAIGGSLKRPEARGTITAGELGFRFGRPRFAPAVVLRDVVVEVSLKDDRVSGRVVASARGANVVAVAEADVHALPAARITVSADALPTAFVRDMLATLGVRLAVVPVEGDLVVALDVLRAADGLSVRGTVAAARLVLVVGTDGSSTPYVLDDVSVNVTVTAASCVYEALRFHAYGGRFAGYGALPFGARRDRDLLVLQLEEGNAEVARALLRLAGPEAPRWAPATLFGRGDLVLRHDLALAVDLALDTRAGTTLAVEVRLDRGNLDGSTARGVVAVGDVVEAFPAVPLAAGLLGIDADVRGGGEGIVARVVVSSDALTPSALPVVLSSVRVLVRASREGVAWNRAEAVLAGGRVASLGVWRASEVLARVSVAGVAVHELPPFGPRAIGTYARGLASGTMVGRRSASGDVRARGDIVLDEAAFPAIDRGRATLERYGLRPPNEDAAAPAVATIGIDDAGLHVRDASIELRGLSVRGELDVSKAHQLSGRADVVLEEEYLRTSKLLTLPRVLGERLVIPIRIEGTAEQPEVHADAAGSLGRFLKDNKVVEFVTSAVEEAQIFFGKERPRDPVVARPSEIPRESTEATLRAAIDEHAADWDALTNRR